MQMKAAPLLANRLLHSHWSIVSSSVDLTTSQKAKNLPTDLSEGLLLSEVPWMLSEAPWMLSEAPWMLSEVPWMLSEVPWMLSEVLADYFVTITMIKHLVRI